VNAGIFQDNQNADYQHDVANGWAMAITLEGTISPLLTKPIERKRFVLDEIKKAATEANKQKNLKGLSETAGKGSPTNGMPAALIARR
jgi:hypothetical protein